MRYPKHAFLMCFVMSIFVGGCGPTQRSLKSKKQSVSTKKNAIHSAQSALEASETYAAFLKGKRGTDWAVSKNQLTQLMNAYLPYPFKGKHLNRKRLSGQFKFHQARNVRIHPDNRITFRLSFAAKDVKAKLKGIIGANRSHAQKIKTAMEGGGNFDVEVFGHIDKKGRYLVIKGHCISVTLQRHNTKRHRDMLKDGINQKFMGSAQYIPLPKGLQSETAKLVTTPHHFVIIKK